MNAYYTMNKISCTFQYTDRYIQKNMYWTDNHIKISKMYEYILNEYYHGNKHFNTLAVGKAFLKFYQF